MQFKYKLIIPTVLKGLEMLRKSVRLTRDSFLKVVAGTVAPLCLLDQCALNAGIFFTMSSNFCPFYVNVKVKNPTPLMTQCGR